MNVSIIDRIKTFFEVRNIQPVEDLAIANPVTNYYYMEENVKTDSIENLKQYLAGKTLIVINTVDTPVVQQVDTPVVQQVVQPVAKKTNEENLKEIPRNFVITASEYDNMPIMKKFNYIPIRSNYLKQDGTYETFTYYLEIDSATTFQIKQNEMVKIVKATKGGGKTKRRKQKKKKQRRSSKK